MLDRGATSDRTTESGLQFIRQLRKAIYACIYIYIKVEKMLLDSGAIIGASDDKQWTHFEFIGQVRKAISRSYRRYYIGQERNCNY